MKKLTINQTPEPEFNKSKFDKILKSKGLQVEWQRAVRCPCEKDDTTQAVSYCKNCNGLGYTYLPKKTILATISAASLNDRKNVTWTENLIGTAMMTVSPDANSFDGKISFMDKIKIIDAETVFSEVEKTETVESLADKGTVLKDDNGITVSTGTYVRLKYRPENFISVLKYIDAYSNLEFIDMAEISIKICNDIYIVFDSIDVPENSRISFTYEYNPVYLVIDIPNDFRNFYARKNLRVEKLEKTLIKAVIKKLHLI